VVECSELGEGGGEVYAVESMSGTEKCRFYYISGYIQKYPIVLDLLYISLYNPEAIKSYIEWLRR